MTVAAGVDVGDVEHGDGTLNVVDHFEDFLEAAPQFLSTRGFHTDFGGCSVLDPGEHGEFVFLVVPDFVDAVNDAGEDIGDLLVGSLASAEIAVVAGMKGDVSCIDGAGGLQRGLNFCQRTPAFNSAAEKFRVVRTVNVHLKIGFVGEHTGLPVLFKVLRCHHANGLDLHGFKAQGDDIVHSFHDGAAFAGKWNTSRTEFDCHPFPSPETDPRDIT